MIEIREYFERSVAVSDKDWDLFSSKLAMHRFSKKSVLLKVGQTENYLSFVQKGIIRFYIPGEVNDLTFSFSFDGAFMSAYDSFLTRTPSSYQVEALTDTTLWRLSYTDLQTIYQETLVGNFIGRVAGEELFLKKSKREFSLLGETAEERYLNLIKEQSHLLKHIPLKYLASYIGITPQALSRIRNRIS